MGRDEATIREYIRNQEVEDTSSSRAACASQRSPSSVVGFVIAVSLEQLSIGCQVLVSAFRIAFGALCLAPALALGLGGREWAARVLDSFFRK